MCGLCYLECAARVGALDGLARVDALVGRQLSLVCRGVAADVAQVVLAVRVHDHVCLQRVLPLEAHGTRL